MKTYIIILTITLTCIGCSKDKPLPATTTNNNNGYYVGDTLTLKANECKTLTDSIDNITFNFCLIDSIKDERCYQSMCYLCFGTSAHIKVLFIPPNNDTTMLDLSIIGCYTSDDCNDNFKKDTLGYSFCFLKLDPYPDTTNVPINQNNYIAKLKITKL